MILIFLAKLVPSAAPSPYANDEVGVFFGMLARVDQALAVYRIELELMSAEVDERLDERGCLFNADIVAENRVVYLECQRSAVDQVGHIVLGEGLYHRKQTVGVEFERGREA